MKKLIYIILLFITSVGASEKKGFFASLFSPSKEINSLTKLEAFLEAKNPKDKLKAINKLTDADWIKLLNDKIEKIQEKLSEIPKMLQRLPTDRMFQALLDVDSIMQKKLIAIALERSNLQIYDNTEERREAAASSDFQGLFRSVKESAAYILINPAATIQDRKKFELEKKHNSIISNLQAKQRLLETGNEALVTHLQDVTKYVLKRQEEDIKTATDHMNNPRINGDESLRRKDVLENLKAEQKARKIADEVKKAKAKLEAEKKSKEEQIVETKRLIENANQAKTLELQAHQRSVEQQQILAEEERAR